MKRALVASVLGLAASAVVAYGQAHVVFENYSSGQPVEWTSNPAGAPAGRAGSLVEIGDGFVANLLWQFGSTSGDAGLRVPVGWPAPGYFSGPMVPIPGYTGPWFITFTVQAWTGADYASSTARGSLTWSEPFFSPGPGGSLNLPGPIIVQYVPEPSALALMALGIALIAGARRCGACCGPCDDACPGRGRTGFLVEPESIQP
jgi:hypothetical protein